MLSDILGLLQLPDKLIDAFISLARWAHLVVWEATESWKRHWNPDVTWKSFPGKTVSWMRSSKQMTPNFPRCSSITVSERWLYSFFFFHLLLYNIVVVFVIHWHELAMDLHVFPIPIPPPTSHSTRSLWLFPVHQVRWLWLVCVSGWAPEQASDLEIPRSPGLPWWLKW